MTTWFSSDTHFGHANIINYSKRPFKDIFHMDAEIVRRWNSVVHPDDTVFHLGDVAMGPYERWDKILTSLNGNIVLVVGNHDRIFAGNKFDYQQRFIGDYNRWFVDYYDNIPSIEIAGRDVALSHFPYDGDSHDGDRYTEYRLKDEGRILIHGHTHLSQIVSRSKAGTLQIHVGQDAWDFTPVSEDQIAALLGGLE